MNLGRVHTEYQRWRFSISPEPIWILILASMLLLALGMNDAIETNVFLSSANASVNAKLNADDRCE